MTNDTFLGVPELSQCQSQNTATLAENEEMVYHTFSIAFSGEIASVHILAVLLKYSTPIYMCLYLPVLLSVVACQRRRDSSSVWSCLGQTQSYWGPHSPGCWPTPVQGGRSL